MTDMFVFVSSVNKLIVKNLQKMSTLFHMIDEKIQKYTNLTIFY